MSDSCPLRVTGHDGRMIEIPVRISRRARRLSLRVDPVRGAPELVLPEGIAPARAEPFILRNMAWLEERLKRLPEPVRFADGANVPLLGISHLLRHVPGQRTPVRRGQTAADGLPCLEISGAGEHLARRLTDWLRKEARREISVRARRHADRLGRRISRIAIRDTKSRWGSCSATGTLSFSWRLILAPEHVLDYVCAHEAAHLVEMNHSPRFWALVDGLVGDMETSRAWLKQHGAALHRYG